MYCTVWFLFFWQSVELSVQTLLQKVSLPGAAAVSLSSPSVWPPLQHTSRSGWIIIGCAPCHQSKRCSSRYFFHYFEVALMFINNYFISRLNINHILNRKWPMSLLSSTLSGREQYYILPNICSYSETLKSMIILCNTFNKTLLSSVTTVTLQLINLAKTSNKFIFSQLSRPYSYFA
jgi:hypothetical protein